MALKYTNDHECIHVEGDVAWVGITKYAQEALGDLVYVELPEIGKKAEKGKSVAVVESVKTAAEVYSPVDGEVIAANDAMPGDLELISKPVTQGGWIAKIRMSNPAQLSGLMDEGDYQSFLKSLD
ncbi:MAG: glycine cleavage system protein GcvH [Alphaproteobacteria bacterium]|nr:glycine cleavage system protein GcvH [Alphaproteobacteria bacterium]